MAEGAGYIINGQQCSSSASLRDAMRRDLVGYRGPVWELYHKYCYFIRLHTRHSITLERVIHLFIYLSSRSTTTSTTSSLRTYEGTSGHHIYIC